MGRSRPGREQQVDSGWGTAGEPKELSSGRFGSWTGIVGYGVAAGDGVRRVVSAPDTPRGGGSPRPSQEGQRDTGDGHREHGPQRDEAHDDHGDEGLPGTEPGGR